MPASIDINVFMDIIFRRKPFVYPAIGVWRQIDSGHVRGCFVSTTVTTLYYLVEKHKGSERAREAVARLLEMFEIRPVNRQVFDLAHSKRFRDFEDAVQDAAAELANVSVIVTRNAKDFVGSTRQIVDADGLIALVESQA